MVPRALAGIVFTAVFLGKLTDTAAIYVLQVEDIVKLLLGWLLYTADAAAE